jgi:peptidoglycan/xylan/chitin deacetylase (PgdA/CDA1 family)
MSDVIRGTTASSGALSGSIGTVQGKSAYEIAVKNGFEGSEQEWLDSLKCVSARRVAGIRNPKPMLTFIDDDARSSFPEKWCDIITDTGIPVTISVSPAKIGGSQYMSWETIKQMVNEYGCETAIHGYDHESLRYSDRENKIERTEEAEVVSVVTQAQEAMDAQGLQSNIYVYPYNETSALARKVLREYCDFAVGGYEGFNYNTHPIDTYFINRTPLTRDEEANNFTLDQLKAFVDDVVANNAWGVFMTHAYQGGFTANMQQIIRDLVAYAREKGVEIVNAQTGYENHCNVIDAAINTDPTNEENYMLVGADGALKASGIHLSVNDTAKYTNQSVPNDFPRNCIITFPVTYVDGLPVGHRQGTITTHRYNNGLTSYCYQVLETIGNTMFVRRANNNTSWKDWTPYSVALPCSGSSIPTTASVGTQIFDINTMTPKWWNGAAWVDGLGSTNANSGLSLGVQNDLAYLFKDGKAIGTGIQLQGESPSTASLPYVLSSTGDTTDRTEEIQNILTTYGVCQLQAGDYYVSATGVVMSDNSTLIGVGASTNVYLGGAYDSTAGQCVTMGSNCTVSDITFMGWTGTVSLAASLIERHGVLWATNASGTAPQNGKITNCRFMYFKGAGITCKDTGTPSTNSLSVSDCFMKTCRAGINVAQKSEYNRFTNINVAGCYYGCINNGGNNVFVNCAFTQNTIGMKMDDTGIESANSGHGSFVGCTFNHSGNNTGVGISITNVTHGFVFSGCQLFRSSISLTNASGIVFDGLNVGLSNEAITVSGGGTVLFNGCMFGNAPTVTITGNENVHFANCYIRATGVEVTNGIECVKTVNGISPDANGNVNAYISVATVDDLPTNSDDGTIAIIEGE